jgi:hypothetical protein
MTFFLKYKIRLWKQIEKGQLRLGFFFLAAHNLCISKESRMYAAKYEIVVEIKNIIFKFQDTYVLFTLLFVMYTLKLQLIHMNFVFFITEKLEYVIFSGVVWYARTYDKSHDSHVG